MVSETHKVTHLLTTCRFSQSHHQTLGLLQYLQAPATSLEQWLHLFRPTCDAFGRPEPSYKHFERPDHYLDLPNPPTPQLNTSRRPQHFSDVWNYSETQFSVESTFKFCFRIHLHQNGSNSTQSSSEVLISIAYWDLANLRMSSILHEYWI